MFCLPDEHSALQDCACVRGILGFGRRLCARQPPPSFILTCTPQNMWVSVNPWAEGRAVEVTQREHAATQRPPTICGSRPVPDSRASAHRVDAAGGSPVLRPSGEGEADVHDPALTAVPSTTPHRCLPALWIVYTKYGVIQHGHSDERGL